MPCYVHIPCNRDEFRDRRQIVIDMIALTDLIWDTWKGRTPVMVWLIK
jgi:hypothetical protein